MIGPAEQAASPSRRVIRVSAADVVAGPAIENGPSLAQLESFESLGIPSVLQQAVERELTRDETTLWRGRPSRNPAVYPSNPVVARIAAGVCFALGAGILFLSLSLQAPNLGAAGRIALVGFALLFAGAFWLFGALLFRSTAGGISPQARECYVVTNRRAMIAALSLFRQPQVRSFSPLQLMGLERRDSPRLPGAGDVIFEWQLQLGKSANPVAGVQSLDGGPVVKVPVGFLHLDSARSVEALIRQTLLAPLEKHLDR